MAVSIKGNVSNVIYGKGDVCLQLSPFDNFRMFTLYEDWRSDDRKPIDLSNDQKVYLVFKSNKKEIRIPEYDIVNEDYRVDKVNGQVLFKISKKNAIDILAMENNIFYITRTYTLKDGVGDKERVSDEEVLYTGLWKDESSNTVDNYTSQIKNLMSLLEERNKQIKDLQESNAELMKQNVEFASTITELQEANEKLESDNAELEAIVTEYQSGAEHEGEVVQVNGVATKYTLIEGKQYTEEQMEEVSKHLQEISQQ